MQSYLPRFIHVLCYGCAPVQHLRIEMCVAGEGTEEHTAVIAGVPQAGFAEHNVQYQFRTENSGGQVRTENFSAALFVCFACFFTS